MILLHEEVTAALPQNIERLLRNLFGAQKQNPFDKHCTFSPQKPIQNFIFNQRLVCTTLEESSSLWKRTTHPRVLYLHVWSVKKKQKQNSSSLKNHKIVSFYSPGPQTNAAAPLVNYSCGWEF